MFAEHGCDHRRVVGVSVAGGVREDRDARRRQRRLLEHLGEPRCAGATSGEWNAQATGSRRARTSRSAHHSTASSIAARGPETTVCVGALRFATTTSSLREQLLERLGRGIDGGHRAGLSGRRLAHEAAARLRQPQQVVLVEHSRRRRARRTRRSCGRRPSPARTPSAPQDMEVREVRRRRAPAGRRSSR